MKRRFLEFIDTTLNNQKTKRFRVLSAHNADELGIIKWDTGWRRYVMEFSKDCKWSIECMSECYKFIAQLMTERNSQSNPSFVDKAVKELNKVLEGRDTLIHRLGGNTKVFTWCGITIKRGVRWTRNNRKVTCLNCLNLMKR